MRPLADIMADDAKPKYEGGTIVIPLQVVLDRHQLLQLVADLTEALQRAADTFTDMERANNMLQRYTVAHACEIAKEAALAVLEKVSP